MQIRRLASAVDIARRNPRLFAQRVGAHVKHAVLPLKQPRTSAVGRGVQFRFDPGIDAMVGQMWAGSYAPAVVSAIRRLLDRGDTAIDVGANIGYISAVMLAEVGPAGEVHAFEPVAEYALRLEELARLNENHRLVVQRIALSDAEGTASIAVSRGNLGWNTMVPGLMRSTDLRYSEDVRTTRLDAYFLAEALAPSLIKIDVEGFELAVLDGLSRYLSTGARPAVICEVAPMAYPRLGRHVADLADWVSAFGYRALDPVDLRTPIVLADLTSTTDIVFLPQHRSRDESASKDTSR